MQNLHDAVASHDTNLVRQLISQGTPLDVPDDREETPLGAAVSCGYKDCVQLLLDAGAKNIGSGRSSPMQIAIDCRDENMLSKIIDCLGTLAPYDKSENPFVMQAVKKNCSEAFVQKLVAAGAIAALQSSPEEALSDALESAIETSNNTSLQMLINQKIEWNDGMQKKIVGILIKKIQFSNCPPATDEKIASVLSLLVSGGFNMNVTDKDEYALLPVACATKYFKTVREMISLGADLNVHSNNQRGEKLTALAVCATDDYAEIGKLLIDKGADVTIHGTVKDGSVFNDESALYHAVHYEKADMVKMLLSTNKIPKEDIQRALLTACCFNNQETTDTSGICWNDDIFMKLRSADSASSQIVSLLVDAGADVNGCIGDRTAGDMLIQAARSGYAVTFNTLVENGINIQTLSHDGVTVQDAVSWLTLGTLKMFIEASLRSAPAQAALKK